MDAGSPTFDGNDALLRLQQLLDPAAINARQAYGPATIYTPWVVVWLLVYQRLHANATLQQAMGELFRLAGQLPRNRRIEDGTLSANTGAYSRARTRLDEAVADGVADAVFDSLMSATMPSWQGRRVFIVDGTTTKLSSRKALRAVYPPAANQHGVGVWPIMHWVVAHELASGCAVRPEIGAMYGPTAVSEVALAGRLIPRIPARSVLMADRNFGVLSFFYAAAGAGHDVVTRLTHARFKSMVRRARVTGPGRWELRWTPTRGERRKHPTWPADVSVSVTLHERTVVSPDGNDLTLWLATTLPADGASVAALYLHRQNVETDIRDVKIALKMDELRGQTDGVLRKELALGMVAYNLVVQVRRLAAQRIQVEPRRLSFTGVWSLVRTVLLSPAEWTFDQWVKQFDWVLRGAGQRKLPNRPGRTHPRHVLPRGRKFPNRPRTPDDQTLK